VKLGDVSAGQARLRLVQSIKVSAYAKASAYAEASAYAKASADRSAEQLETA
jgi:hypothetical protein